MDGIVGKYDAKINETNEIDPKPWYMRLNFKLMIDVDVRRIERKLAAVVEYVIKLNIPVKSEKKQGIIDRTLIAPLMKRSNDFAIIPNEINVKKGKIAVTKIEQ
jgi:hypothetical protein